MSDDIDYSTLSLEERIEHKVWKARLLGYEELSKQFENSRNQNDPIFNLVTPDLLKKILTDSNVVAQEAGYKCFISYLKFGGSTQLVTRLVSKNGIIQPICEKGLSSSRKGTKDNAIESILTMIEYMDDPSPIVEEIIPTLNNKLPKLVASCVSCLVAIYENYGCKIVSPNLVIPTLPKLFAHADKNVRAETTKLTVELYKWMKTTLSDILFPDLKPIQQKDLTTAFDKIANETPQQKRLTNAQKEELKAKESQSAEDVEMSDVTVEEEVYDPLQFVNPTEVLSKLPHDLETRISSTKWKDRVEVLEEVYAILQKHPKLVTSDDYAPIFRIFAKNMKDANIQVVQIAANCSNLIAKGLGPNFTRYQNLILSPVIERTKEKKPTVATALSELLDTMFSISGLSGSILEEAISGMKLKVPQNKISSANFLQRCLANTTKAPTSSEIDSIMEVGVKLLSDSQEPIRQASTELIGTLMKITGERELNKFLETTDDNRKAKIMKFYESVEIKCSKSSAPPTRESYLKKPVLPKSTSSIQSSRTPSSTSTIPSKRSATSPAKRKDDIKASNLGKGLTTSRSLAKPTAPNLRPPKPNSATSLRPSESIQQPQIQIVKEFDEAKQEELDQLRIEVKNYKIQQTQQQALINKYEEENTQLKEEIKNMKSHFENEIRSNSITINHKDTQLNNFKIEIDKLNHRIKDLESEQEIKKLQQSNQSYFSSTRSSYNQQPGSYKQQQQTQQTPQPFQANEISSGVKRLSIGNLNSNDFPARESLINGDTTNNYNRLSPSTYRPINKRENMDIDSGDDWKRAAEVTSQLKARIERMKARARTPLNVE
ncbi:uncharacterized protein KGF55_003879 [Candida pseudojiufengensis]|uniref:uncharacterized protein n=1 Tax=Candida pseudojiufengensis TaxID=497109 RepID=UPI002224A98B|nr:uncharacterized protein KGF55_003879 [Candida pseudojiufengensis]KAI5961908.1 hypothetical protein KGF55_003879 [Candida pseudojiufengensis]